MAIVCVEKGAELICRGKVHPELWTWEWVILGALFIGSLIIFYSLWRAR